MIKQAKYLAKPAWTATKSIAMDEEITDIAYSRHRERSVEA
jgi:hypothetical protein